MNSAAENGHIEVVQLMLNLGVKDDIAAMNEAMCKAACDGKPDVIRLLLRHGANDYRAAMNSARTGPCSEVVMLMLKQDPSLYQLALSQASPQLKKEIEKWKASQ
jgi:hypothetical protein